MGYFPVKYNSRVVIYERKMFIIWPQDWARNIGDVQTKMNLTFN